MQYVTREAPEEASHARKFRYPFVTVELLTCAPNQFLQVLVKAENSQVMDTLWSFMEADPPADVNPVLAGYFSRAVAAVLSKHPAELAGYLRARGAEALLDRFMERLHLRSLAELFAILACAEAEANLVFPTEGLVKRLLTQFAKPSPGCETQERVTCLIDFMLEKKDAICFADDLLKQLISTDTISFLVDRVFSSESGVVSAACSTLSSIVDHCYVKDQSNASFRASTPLMSPVAPPPPPPDLGDEGVVNVGDDLVNEAAPRSPGSASPSSVGKLGTPSQTYLEAMEGDLMGEICRHFPRICELLDAAIERRATQAMPIGTVPAAGNTCIVVVNLLVMLARTGSATVLDALSKHDLIPRCFELFFRHPWNNLLHNAVLELVTKVLSGVSDAVRPTLLVHLLRERGLLERLVAEMQAEKEHGPPGSARHARVGYMGHLHMLCRKLLDYLVRHTSLNSVFSEVSGWTDTIIPAMHEHSAIVIAELGAHESGIRCFVSLRGARGRGKAQFEAMARMGPAGGPAGGSQAAEARRGLGLEEEEVAEITRLIRAQMAIFARSLSGVQQQVAEMATALSGRTEELRDLIRQELRSQRAGLADPRLAAAQDAQAALVPRVQELEQAFAQHADALAATERRLERRCSDIDQQLQRSSPALARDGAPPLGPCGSPAPCFGWSPAEQPAADERSAIRAHYTSIRDSLEFIRRTMGDAPARLSGELDSARDMLEAGLGQRDARGGGQGDLEAAERLSRLQAMIAEQFEGLADKMALPRRLERVEHSLSTVGMEQRGIKETTRCKGDRVPGGEDGLRAGDGEGPAERLTVARPRLAGRACHEPGGLGDVRTSRGVLPPLSRARPSTDGLLLLAAPPSLAADGPRARHASPA
ncbi:unnamed protein product [Prorocentrum cordatum]|uniref:Serine/threonine-protein phosphatase 4 regulatory subunit 3-like central domain-containing protein n=1 Tax=Prorocentrum cordatum TaxID=2364126 RepID=A0ABN9RL73_9DINO|nr:unnamed protein product [Polarella glacialis]